MGAEATLTTPTIGRHHLAALRDVARFGVLMVGNNLSASRPGSSSVTEELAAKLSAKGWQVLQTSDKSGRLHRLSDMLLTVWRKRKEYSVAEVAVFSGPAFIWAELVCWLLFILRKPYVLTLQGGNLPAFTQRWQRRVRWVLNSASIVTTPSRYVQEALRPYRADLRLLPNPIELGSYPFRLRSSPQPKLIWLRAIHEIYNPIMAVRAVAHLLNDAANLKTLSGRDSQSSILNPRLSDCHLTMFGPDKGDGSLQRLKAQIQRLKLGEQVHLEGAVAKLDVPKALNAGDIFLNTTNYESFGVSVMEAAACGLCIVTTNVGELSLLWKDGHDALLVKPDDAKAMAAAVARILREPALAERLSRNARAKAEQYDWSVILPRWEQLLTEVAQKDNGTAGPRDDGQRGSDH